MFLLALVQWTRLEVLLVVDDLHAQKKALFDVDQTVCEFPCVHRAIMAHNPTDPRMVTAPRGAELDVAQKRRCLNVHP